MIRFARISIVASMKRRLVYRFGYFSDVLGMALSVLIQYCIWRALLSDGGNSFVSVSGFLRCS